MSTSFEESWISKVVVGCGLSLGPVAMQKPDASGPSSWIPRVEIEMLRREAAALIEPAVHRVTDETP